MLVNCAFFLMLKTGIYLLINECITKDGDLVIKSIQAMKNLFCMLID